MIPMTLAEVADLAGGALTGPTDVVVTGKVTLDSRMVVPGDLFVAFPGERVDGPHVQAPAVVVERARELGAVAAAGGSAALVGLPARPPESPSPTGLVTVAASVLRAGTTPDPLVPLYLRRPDAMEPGARKRVSAE